MWRAGPRTRRIISAGRKSPASNRLRSGLLNGEWQLVYVFQPKSYPEMPHTKAQSSTRISAQTMLEDKRNNTVYTIVAFRHLTYDEMLASVRRFYRTWHPRRRTWLKNHRIRICTDLGVED